MHIVDITDPAKPKETARWRPKLVFASWWNDGLVILDVGNGVKGGTPSNPVLVSQLKYDLDSLYARVALEGGPGFIRGTHTAWRHRDYVFIADEVFGNAAAQQLFSWQPTRAYMGACM